MDKVYACLLLLMIGLGASPFVYAQALKFMVMQELAAHRPVKLGVVGELALFLTDSALYVMYERQK